LNSETLIAQLTGTLITLLTGLLIASSAASHNPSSHSPVTLALRSITPTASVPATPFPAVPALTASSPSDPSLTRYEFSEPHMGTLFRMIIYAPDQAAAEQAADSAFQKAAYLNSIFSDYDEHSELSRLSATSGSGTAVPVSRHLFDILTVSQNLSAETGGSFDVTAGPYTLAWREAVRGLRPEIPKTNELQQLAGSVGYRHLELDTVDQTVLLHRPDMRLDLGGIAKGYTAQRMMDVMQHFGFNRVLVDAGGDMVLGDPPPDSGGWQIAVPSLKQKNHVETENDDEAATADQAGITYLKLSNIALTTSGDLYQYVEQDGIRYSHIVDPHTGMGVTRQTSVLVVGGCPTLVDGLATALNVMPPDEGLALIENRNGYYARIALLDDNGLTIHEAGTLPVASSGN
jgi:FAD:protein FMN transferase